MAPNRGVLSGVVPERILPPWLGTGDPVNDGSLVVADSTQPGDIKLASYPERSLLYKATASTPYKVYHQIRGHIVASGTFVTPSATYWIDIDLRVLNQGFAYADFVLVVGVNGGAANTPLYGPNLQAGYFAATGVTEFRYEMAASMDWDAPNADHHVYQCTGLTVGRTYTWQLVGGMAGASQTISTVGSNPYFAVISPDNRTLWVSNNGDNTVQFINLGWRPGWRLGLVPVFSSSGDPILVGVGAYGIAISPNGQYVCVCNNTDKTVTAINALTHQVIGTTTAFTSAVYFCTFTLDSTVCWVGSGDGKVYPLTMSLTAAPSIGTGILVRNANDIIENVLCHPDGRTLWVANFTANAVYAATLATNTTLGAWSNSGALGASISATNLTTSMTYGTVASSITLTSTPFSFSVTNVIGMFPAQSKTIFVPISGSYVAITYAYSVTPGGTTTTTFYGCTGGGGQSTVAGTVFFDKGVWISGTGSGIDHLPSPGSAPDILYSTTLGVTSMWISNDHEEMWISGGASNQVEGRQISDGQLCMAPSGLGSSCQTVVGSSDGYVYVTLAPAGKGAVFNWQGGICTIDPTYSGFTGRLVVTGYGVGT
jgi:hypothetical protein